jgi:hypothetical protein
LTREILRRHSSGSKEFPKLAIPVLNQIIRPFAAKWHKIALTGAFDRADQRLKFRAALDDLQVTLRSYTRALAAMAQVEDWTDLESDR